MTKAKKKEPYSDLLRAFDELGSLLELNKKKEHKRNITLRKASRNTFLNRSMNRELVSRLVDHFCAGSSLSLAVSVGDKTDVIHLSGVQITCLQQALEDKLYTELEPKVVERNGKWMAVTGFGLASFVAIIMGVMQLGVSPLSFSPAVICVLAFIVGFAALGSVGAGLFASVAIPKHNYNKQLSLLTQSGGSLKMEKVDKPPLIF